MLSHTRGAGSSHLGDHAELDLTESRRPWPGIIAAHEDRRCQGMTVRLCMRATGLASKGGVPKAYIAVTGMIGHTRATPSQFRVKRIAWIAAKLHDMPEVVTICAAHE